MDKHTGAALKERREAAGILGYKLASRMGVASSRVSQIEALAEVTPVTARRYIDALEALEASQLASTSGPIEATA